MQSISEKQNIQIRRDIRILNNKRMKYLSIISVFITLLLFVVDNKNRSIGLWDSNSAYKLLFYSHIGLLMVFIFGILIYFLIKDNSKYNIYYILFVLLLLDISSITSGYIDQYIHKEISVYIIFSLFIAIVFSIKPLYSIFIYVQSYILLVVGLFITRKNLDTFQGNLINSTLVFFLAMFISILIYIYTKKEYYYKYNLEYLVKERTSELLDANNLLKLEISERERMQTEKVEQLTRYLALQTELSSSNELIADIIENMPDGFYALDNEWCFMFANKKAEELFLKTQEELLGKVLWMIDPQALGTLLEVNYQKAMNDCVPMTFDFISSLQKNRWHQITVFPCQFGLSVYYKDITEQKLSRKKLNESQKETVSILESMTDCFIAIDRDWRFTYINRAGEIAFGKSRNELLGRKITEIFSINDTTQAHYHVVMNEKRSVNFEVISEALGGKWLEVSAYPTESGLTCYFRDITSRKKAENEIARLDRLNLVGQLASGIAHEIRNPMSTVRGYLQLLGEKPEYEVRKTTFDLMISELDRANSIITEFLSLAQIKPTELKSQNLNDIINNLYPLLEADTFTRNKQISFIQGEIPNLNLNGKEISQLILNLVRNGLESMEERGTLTIKSFVEDDAVVLVVEDEGKGILPENLSKLGTPFFTTKDTGTGLGLATSYKIAESHNAKISINSSFSGTTFCVLFPIPEKVHRNKHI